MGDDRPDNDKGSHRIDLFVQRQPTTETKRSRVNIPQVLSGSAELLKAVTLAAVVGLIAANWSYFTTWLNAVTHVEVLGAKIDRTAATEKIRKISLSKGTDFNAQFAEGALVRAEAVLPALSGARVLWVDRAPSNNVLEQGILQDIGIRVQLALTTKDALALSPQGFDLVISNIPRPGDISTALKRCGAVYFDFPSDDLRTKYGGDLSQFNAQIRANPPAGFAMAEEFAQQFPDRFGDTQVPRIIFYTSASGGIAASQCARIVTNRADVFLQSVVSALEELRWKELVTSKTKADVR
jgi:CheY-like chemotaxis protein